MLPWTLYFGADHRGFEKKNQLIKLASGCHSFLNCIDLGPSELDPDDDFNDSACKVAKAVLGGQEAGEQCFGVLICGSAHGVSMQANRFRNIRAINAHTPESAQVGRAHDHANVLCLSADDLDIDTMNQILKSFCHTHEDDNERYVRRCRKLDEYDKE